MKDEMQENNPLLEVYKKVLPATVIAVVVIYFLVKVISGLIAPKELVIQASYGDFEQGAVMQVPMQAATDETFENELKYVQKQQSGFSNAFDFLNIEGEKEVVEENGTYTFKYEYRETPETVYVKAPEWWTPVNTEGNMMLPAEIGAESGAVEDYGTFLVSNIEVVKISTGIFNINVIITSAGEAAVSDLKLIMGGYVFEEWDGSTELVYDEETGFADRTVVFRYNREALEDISHLMEDAELMVQEYTVHKTYEDAVITSNLEGLEIVLK